MGLVALLLIMLIMPIPKDEIAYSKALYSREGELLSASTSTQQQWRLPFSEDVPEKMKLALVTYEDAYFYYHIGVNPVSIIKAIITNITSGRITRGASTIPMQVMRMRSGQKSRSLWRKAYESIAAIKYSLSRSKSTVIKDWVSVAPFGGNTIGIKAAALRYFGADIDDLSWSQYALLAVMPNGPSTANLTRNRDVLKRKRDFLLDKLAAAGHIAETDVSLYKDEELPTYINKVPQNAYHLLDFASKGHPESFLFASTIEYGLQSRMQEIIDAESQFYKLEDIRNMAAVVIDVTTNQLVSYVGNTVTKDGQFSYVDIVQSPRSYGSLLKPLLYSMAIDQGYILPGEAIEDIPTVIGDFEPENFDKKYRGLVSADDVILQSLNIPAVRLLQQVGLKNFYTIVEKTNLAYLNKGADHYGLSLILGGGESSLWDLARLYKGFAQNRSGIKNPYREVQYLMKGQKVKRAPDVSFSDYAIDATIRTMSNITRPREERSWESFGSNQKIAWKTGTSFGHRDAWAIGFNGKYAVAIWVGNENGEARYELTGVIKAAPILFKVFNALNKHQWFGPTIISNHKHIISVCKESGKMAGPTCKHIHKIKVPRSSMRLDQCQYHQIVKLSDKGKLIPNSCTLPVYNTDTMFSLPPHVAFYYKQSHIEYVDFIAIDERCNEIGSSSLAIIYPQNNIKMFAPKILDEINPIVAKAFHPNPSQEIYWFLDETFLGKTYGLREHNMTMKPSIGQHILTIVDQQGNRSEAKFEMLSR
jgi:penicillin-binding protein 1C